MIPDISFELYFRPDKKDAVLEAMDHVFEIDGAGKLQSGRSDGSMNAAIELPIGSDKALANWRALNPEMHLRVPVGRVKIAVLTLWLRADKVERDDKPLPAMCLTIWPVTSFMQKTCLESTTLRKVLVEMLGDCDGIAGYVDEGDGNLSAFWPTDESSI